MVLSKKATDMNKLELKWMQQERLRICDKLIRLHDNRIERLKEEIENHDKRERREGNQNTSS